jgi:hypothetical protein
MLSGWVGCTTFNFSRESVAAASVAAAAVAAASVAAASAQLIMSASINFKYRSGFDWVTHPPWFPGIVPCVHPSSL